MGVDVGASLDLRASPRVCHRMQRVSEAERSLADRGSRRSPIGPGRVRLSIEVDRRTGAGGIAPIPCPAILRRVGSLAKNPPTTGRAGGARAHNIRLTRAEYS